MKFKNKKEIFKCIFIPFYLCLVISRNKREMSNSDHYSERYYDYNNWELLALLQGIFLSVYIIFRFSLGVYGANSSTECRVKSIGDVIITPMYTLGCNIGKDRFDIKVN